MNRPVALTLVACLITTAALAQHVPLTTAQPEPEGARDEGVAVSKSQSLKGLRSLRPSFETLRLCGFETREGLPEAVALLERLRRTVTVASLPVTSSTRPRSSFPSASRGFR